MPGTRTTEIKVTPPAKLLQCLDTAGGVVPSASACPVVPALTRAGTALALQPQVQLTQPGVPGTLSLGHGWVTSGTAKGISGAGKSSKTGTCPIRPCPG